MRKTDIWIGVLCCFLLIACDGKKQKSLSVNDDNKSLTFTLSGGPYYVAIPGRPAELYGTALLGSF